jgi:formylglycine-generating enzyme required for sulfatase activity
MMLFLRCVGEALVARGMRGLVGLAPYGEQVYDVAADVAGRYREARREKQIAADLQAVLQASGEQVRAEAQQLAHEVAAGRPEAEVRLVEAYLAQLPGVARQSLRRPEDPCGVTVPAFMNLDDPAKLASVLPRRAPRFRIGDAMPHAPQWQFVELLGSGGFGEVWLVRHTFLDECRAVKFCLDPAAREGLLRHEGQVVKRVMAESKGLKSAGHGIVPLVDAYLAPDADAPWLAYEYVEGGDLAGLVRQVQQTAPPQRAAEALALLRDLAAVVGRFHRLPQPIIHRDLKPANILLKNEGGRLLLRVTDFGISHVAATSNIRATVSTPSMSLGETYRGAHTPIYASPQQKRGEKADVRDDVYALGVIGYQLLLGDLAAERPTRSWRRRVADCTLPEALLDLLESCWDDYPDERPPDAQALAEGLTATLDQGPFRPALPDDPQPLSSAPAQALPGPPSAGPHGREKAGNRAEAVVPPAAPVAEPARVKRQREEPKRQSAPKKVGDILEEPLTPTLSMKLAWVPPGKSWLGGGGGEPGTKEFTLPEGLWCCVYPVTQGEWEAVMGSNPSHFKGHCRNPVECVSREDIQTYLEKLNEQLDGRGQTYRLPTEEEWEYICRGGPLSPDLSAYDFYFAQSKTDLTPWPTNDLSSTTANFDGNQPAGRARRGPYLERTSEVGRYLSNPLGICDLHGNVWEWTSTSEDPFGFYGVVLRGGSWGNNGRDCTASSRFERKRTARDSHLGFRVLAVPSGSP